MATLVGTVQVKFFDDGSVTSDVHYYTDGDHAGSVSLTDINEFLGDAAEIAMRNAPAGHVMENAAVEQADAVVEPVAEPALETQPAPESGDTEGEAEPEQAQDTTVN